MSITPEYGSARGFPIRILLAYLSVFIFWGSTYLAIRIGVQDIPPAPFAGLRFMIAGGALLLYGKLNGNAFPSRKQLRHLGTAGLFLLVGGNGLVVWAEQWIHSGLAALIVATVPLFMATIDSFLPGGQRLSPVGWFGIIVGLAGVVILVSPTFGDLDSDAFKPIGILGLFVASLFWSIGSLYAKHNRVDGNIFVNAGVQMLAGGLVLILLGIAGGEFGQIRFTTSGNLALLYLVIFGSIIGFTSYVYLLRHVPAAKASTYAYVNPVVAVILGALVLSEPIDARTIFATLVILGGVGIVQLSTTRTR